MRTRNQLLAMSIRDSMTGLYNRRGMNLKLDELLGGEHRGDKLFVAVIDMNGLKKINDTYGHTEGDAGILLISKAVKQSALRGEICVRAGGDEFYVIGVGKYDAPDTVTRETDFRTVLEELQADVPKPYKVTASVGCAIEPVVESLNFDAVLSRADKMMYKEKLLARAAAGEGSR